MENGKTSYSDKKIAAYIRVSTTEQAIHGLSIGAQMESLDLWARENFAEITDYYIDAGISARKSASKRAELQRLIRDVEAGKINLIVFTKLDRWFRSLKDYYKVQEILDKKHVDWKAIQEEYDTSTAQGKLLVNMKLSIAEHEAELGRERIAAVFNSKIRHGTAVSGKCPFGYRVNEEKRLEVVPEQAAIVQDAFRHYMSTVSQRGTIRYIRETYGVNWCDVTFRRMLQERLYTGYYEKNGRINTDFCQPIITQELFDTVQKLMENNAKSSPTGRVYLFTSLLVCAECGHKLAALKTGRCVYYRCNQHFQRGRCSHKKEIREEVIEEWLFENLGPVFREYKANWELKEAKKKASAKTVDRASVRRRLSKLKELFVNDLIDLETYRRDYEPLSKLLEDAQEPEKDDRPNFEDVEAFLNQDFQKIYNSDDRAEKRTLWRSIIKEIRINMNNEITELVFL